MSEVLYLTISQHSQDSFSRRCYEPVRQLWNGKVKTRPAAIVRCLSVEDVIHTVRWTRAHGLPLSVRGAGHEIFGRCARMAW